MNYQQQLADPRWQKRRLEVLQLANWSCSDCGRADEQLHVHHPRYIKGRKAWEYNDDELEALCKTCHQLHHQTESALQDAIHSSGYGARFISGIGAGFLDASMDLDVEESGARQQFCCDAMEAGSVAYMYFHAHRNTKAAIARLLADEGVPRNPVEQALLDSVASLGREAK